MKRHIVSTVVAILSLSVFDSCLYAGAYGGGTGEPNNPYKIAGVADWQELMATSTDWDKSFILTADIDLASVNLIPVGNIEIQFTGILDGDNHVIRNAIVNQSHEDFTAIFGYISNGGQIQNLGVEDVNMIGSSGVGGLAGFNESGSITNCHSTGSLSGFSHIGGLVGTNCGLITSSYSTASVSGYDHVGGLVGAGLSGSVTSCYSTGSVSGGWWVGGLAGFNVGSIVSCDSSGSVNGGSGQDLYIGGLVGYNTGSITSCRSSSSVTLTREFGHARDIGGLAGYNDGSITSCCSTGTVSATASEIIVNVGGLVGRNYQGSIIFCRSTGAVNGIHNVGGLVGFNNSGSIISCCSMAAVTGTGDPVGGLVGSNEGGSLNYCYATGTVSGVRMVGGLAGENYGSMAFCYSTGSVSGTGDYIGGLVGDGMTATSCFWDTQTSGQTSSSGGTGKTTAEMQTLATFLDAGWDFLDETTNGTDDIWFMPPEDYPHLTWELPPEFELSVSPTTLWPANHKMIKITPSWTVTDLYDPSPQVSLVDITMNEPGNADDIQISDDGSIYLCATRSGNSKARIYTLTYKACDSTGNCTTRTCTVIVPHDHRK